MSVVSWHARACVELRARCAIRHDHYQATTCDRFVFVACTCRRMCAVGWRTVMCPAPHSRPEGSGRAGCSNRSGMQLVGVGAFGVLSSSCLSRAPLLRITTAKPICDIEVVRVLASTASIASKHEDVSSACSSLPASPITHHSRWRDCRFSYTNPDPRRRDVVPSLDFAIHTQFDTTAVLYGSKKCPTKRVPVVVLVLYLEEREREQG